ncbi:hypothetical protein RPB_0053 [Rhodopseudomonas palustris HaA2]|uniref:Invasion associated locus B family protein n=1 Tax=Rhodopseudomonas palustris (strain HaA2) TaxID=316058 RepID=Q2J445_RHOP2|nr:hypothetical protein [Rhodopseudomonas palustris]ABD04765.1 hypothetical protein RPB_0053 [Rhodopseudomonas palustris HaA2]
MIHRHLLLGLLSAAAVAASPCAASAQDAKAKKYAEVGGWTVESYSMDGQYMRCGAIVPGAVKIAFEKSAEGWTVVVPTTLKTIPDEIKGSVELDGKAAKASFYGGDAGRVMTFLKDPQIKALRTAKSFVVKAGQETTPVPLAGIDAALRKAAECDGKGG